MRDRRIRFGGDAYNLRMERNTRQMLLATEDKAGQTIAHALTLEERLDAIEAADTLARSDISTLMDITRALSSQVQGEQQSIDTMAHAIGVNSSDIGKLVQSSATLATFVAKMADDTTAALKALGDRATATAAAITSTNQAVAALDTATKANAKAVADLAAVVAAIPRPVLIGTVNVSFGGLASLGLQPRKTTVTMTPLTGVANVKKDELLICRHTAAVPDGFGFDSASCFIDGKIEFVFTTPALTVLVTTTMPMAVYAMRAG